MRWKSITLIESIAVLAVQPFWKAILLRGSSEIEPSSPFSNIILLSAIVAMLRFLPPIPLFVFLLLLAPQPYVRVAL